MRKLLLLLLGFSHALLAQPTVPIQPDCFIQFNQKSTTGVSGSFDNRNRGCVDWTIVYTTQGFSAISFEFDSAPDAAGVPGSFVAFAGTLVSGSNPSTTTGQSLMQFSGYFPWLRLNLSSKTGTGTITANAFGFRPIAFNTLKSAQNITQIGGLSVFACNSQALFNLSSSGNTQIIAASGSNRTLICHLSISFASAVDAKVTQGTGSNCGSGTADVTGLYKNVVAQAFDWGPFAPLVGSASQAICLNSSANVVGGGIVIFTQQP